MTLLRIVAVLALFGAGILPTRACNETTMLDFIGSLEAPGGFDTVYYGVRIAPPRPITTMSVGEVLDWQRRTVRGGSVSSAAGRYQIVRPTLKRLVDTGVVSRGETFDAATQQRLGLHLLRETGYRAGDTSAATANRIAGVWAALPRIGGPGAGRSVYEGIAGNHALVKAGTYRGVLECRIAPEYTVAEASGRVGTMDCSIAPLTEPDMRTTHPALWIGSSKCQLKLGRYLRGVKFHPSGFQRYQSSCEPGNRIGPRHARTVGLVPNTPAAIRGTGGSPAARPHCQKMPEKEAGSLLLTHDDSSQPTADMSVEYTQSLDTLFRAEPEVRHPPVEVAAETRHTR